ncbi:MAG: J domain-containing protein [Pseudomonadota bacterium]
MRAASTGRGIDRDDPARIAARWLAGLATSSLVAVLRDEELPSQPIATLAAFATVALQAGRTLLILVPDDDPLPELSNALDIALRPLCLVLPAADFAARIALRATLSLLGSRLARDTEATQGAAWVRQRQHIADHAELWQQARAWAAQNDRSDCPVAVARLFPVRILPLGAFRSLQQQAADITLLYRCHAPAELVAPSGRMLRVGRCAAARSGHALAASDESARLILEREQLTRDIGDLELELATVQAEVAEFMRYYYERVGQRMAQRDALQARLAAAEAARAPQDVGIGATAKQWQQQAEQSARETDRFAEAAAEEAPVFRPGNDIKRLFRQIAQQIHPDRAGDEADRAWRTRLMSEANRAYRHGDVGALHEVAALWAEGSAATAPDPAATGGVRHVALLGQQVARLRVRLGEIERELHRLFGSRLYELFIANRQAQRQGRDLLGEMAAQLDASIAELRRSCGTDAA